ncbi:MAG: FixH family protein [Gemmatimonadales bacterium]
MTSILKRGAMIAAGTFFFLGLTGMAAHHLIPHRHVPPDAEFGLGPRTSATGRYQATIEADAALRTGRFLAVRLLVADSTGKPVDGAVITVDGGMPQHGHGLPTAPRVTRALGDGRYQVDGLKFSMGGWWELRFGITTSAGADSVTFNLKI